MNTAAIRAIGTAAPPERLTREAWLAFADRITPREVSRALLARLADRSEIESRGAAAATEPPFYADDLPPGTAARRQLWSRTARAMAEHAAREALAAANADPASVTHVVTASCTGFESPGIDAHLIERLGLSRAVTRINIGFMGCHAAVNALAVARNATLADPAARALVVCAEVCSAHFHYSARVDQLIANTLFGDGAAAVVVDGARHAAPHAPLLAATHSLHLSGSAGEMAWTVGDHGFEMTLGARVPDILQAEVGAWVASTLATHGLAIGDVGAWAIHPGGPRVIESVLVSLGLPSSAGDASRAILRAHGNMSSATLLFILERLLRANAPRPWVGLAFGPGLVGEMVVVR
ncbi:MAG: type III polyketide synthase [bacterium]